MLELGNEGSKEFAVVNRWLDDEDNLHTLPLVLITNVPKNVTVPDLKGLIDSIGTTFLDGVVDAQVDWAHGSKLLPDDKWDDKLKADMAQLKLNATRVNEEYEGVPYVRDPEDDDALVLLYQDMWFFCRIVTYSGLLDSLKGEKRITLRLPMGLHSALARASQSYGSLNSYCIKTLAASVNYSDIVDEFEAQRRKPGRPKKADVGS